MQNGRPVQGADVDLIGGPPDVTWAAIQKFVSFRMLAARREGKPAHDPAVVDLERIEQLILETRQRVEASAPVLRRLLIVSVADFDPHNDAGMKPTHDQLLKARLAAEEAAKRAMQALPLEQPASGVPEENAGKAWDLLNRGMPWTGASAKPSQEENLRPIPGRKPRPRFPSASNAASGSRWSTKSPIAWPSRIRESKTTRTGTSSIRRNGFSAVSP
jgi:hypothetical protein